jgi:hypothetical protein
VVFVVVFLFPIALAVLAAIVAVVVVRMSTLRITSEGVEIRNYPQPAKVIPLPQVTHFEATPRGGNMSSIRPSTAVLVLVDGTRVPVRTVTAPDAGKGVDALNRRVEALRSR